MEKLQVTILNRCLLSTILKVVVGKKLCQWLVQWLNVVFKIPKKDQKHFLKDNHHQDLILSLMHRRCGAN